MNRRKGNVVDMAGIPVPQPVAAAPVKVMGRAEARALLLSMWRWALIANSAAAIIGLGGTIAWFIWLGTSGPREVFAMSVAAYLLLRLALHAFAALSGRGRGALVFEHLHHHRHDGAPMWRE